MRGMPTGSTDADLIPRGPTERVLVTGATGFIARHAVKALERRGHPVIATVRQPINTTRSNVIAVGDIGPDTQWGRALDGVDAVVHLAGRVHVLRERAPDPLTEFRRVNVEGTARLVAAAQRAGIRTFVFVSSIGVVAAHSESQLDESAPCRPATPYAISKLEAEAAVMAASTVRTIILRPPLVYGAGAPGNFDTLLRAIRNGWVLPFGAVRNRRSFMYVGNLADAIAHVVDDSRAVGVYHVADSMAVSTCEFIRLIAAAVGVRARLLPVPVALLRAAGQMVGLGDTMEKLIASLVIDSRRVHRDTGWEPPWSLERAMPVSTATP